MALSGTQKDARLQASLSYSNNHLTPVPEPKAEPMEQGSDPDVFPGPGASVTPISVGSKLLKPPARYRECLKNHAANIGGSITDGCGEFMPSGDEGTLEALKCAACNCHRNFHRKETATPSFLSLPPPPSPFHHYRTPPPLLHHHPHHPNWVHPPLKISAGGSGGATESSSEELNFGATPALPHKRFRTKFTQEQKERMLEFAEKVGWRIPRADDAEVQRFCAEVGVKRQVLKVWMHNNKAISGKKQDVHECTD